MNYEEIEPYIIDYLKGNVEEAMEYRIKAYLQQNPAFQKELDELQETLDFVEQVPLTEPAPQLKMDFYAMLNAYKTEEAKAKEQISLWDKILAYVNQWTFAQRISMASFVMLVFLTGYWSSFLFNPMAQSEKAVSLQQEAKTESPENESVEETNANEEKVTENTQANKAIKQLERKEAEKTAWVAQLDERKASKKMEKNDDMPSLMMEKSLSDDINTTTQGLARDDVYAKVIESDERIETIYASVRTVNQEDKIINALIQALMTDPNANVRIAAIDALEKFADSDAVKYQIANTLEYQESPAVQLATIDLIVKYEIKAGKESLQKFLKRSNLNPQVKAQAEIALKVVG